MRACTAPLTEASLLVRGSDGGYVSESDHLCEECYQGLGPAEKEGYEDFERWG